MAWFPTGHGRVVVSTKSDPDLAVGLFLLELQRDNGVTAAQFNTTVEQARAEARSQGVPEDELEAFLMFHFGQQLSQALDSQADD